MFLFMLAFIALIIIRPQEYPALAGTIPVPLLPLSIAGAAACWLFSSRKTFAAPQYLLLLAFLLALMMSKVVNGWMGGALMVLSRFGLCVVAFVLIANAMNTRRRIHAAMVVFCLCALVLAIHGIDQVRTGIGWTGAELSQGTRIQYIGIFGDPNDLGLLFAMCVPMALYLSGRGGAMGLRRLFWWAVSAVLLYGIVLTDSRGTLLAVAAMVGVYIWMRRGVVAAGAMVAAALGVMMMLPSRLQQMEVGEASAMGRVVSWYHGLQMFFGKPVLGVGAGAYSDIYYLTAHNSFVLVLAESGFIGFSIWIAFLGYCILMPLAAVRSPLPPGTVDPADVDPAVMADWQVDRKLAAALMLSMCGFLAAGFFLSRSYVVVLYMLAALVTAQYWDMKTRHPALQAFSLGHDIIRWPAYTAAGIAGLYVGVKVLLAIA
ncbi:MAG: O-antigen polymerase [Gammaproteobacteria bacterium]|nr:O-antigen polymerase [Gammaproteobacteria bacterium]